MDIISICRNPPMLILMNFWMTLGTGLAFMPPDLAGANLTNANLSQARLFGVNLSHANLSGENLSEANLDYAKFENTVLSASIIIQPQKLRINDSK